MIENRFAPSSGMDVGSRNSVWDKGALRRIPNKYIRRPLKVVRASVTVPQIFWKSRGGGITGLRLPDFLGIGAARCGTTWLHHNLAAHPEVCMPETKEQRFWNSNLARGIGSYARSFDCAAGEKIGEITPTYGVMEPWRIRLMARVVPDARLIYLIRNPIERAWSHVSLSAHNRGLAVEELPRDQVMKLLTSKVFDRNAAYWETYEVYAETFSPEQIFFGFYDDIVTRPQGLLADVFRHLDVSAEVDWASFPTQQRFHSYKGGDIKTTNPTVVPTDIRRFLSERYSDDMRRTADTFGGLAVEWMKDAKDLLAGSQN